MRFLEPAQIDTLADTVDELEVARRAGHASVVTVLDRYGHLLPKDEDTVTDTLDAMLKAGAAKAKQEAEAEALKASGRHLKVV